MENPARQVYASNLIIIFHIRQHVRKPVVKVSMPIDGQMVDAGRLPVLMVLSDEMNARHLFCSLLDLFFSCLQPEYNVLAFTTRRLVREHVTHHDDTHTAAARAYDNMAAFLLKIADKQLPTVRAATRILLTETPIILPS